MFFVLISVLQPVIFASIAFFMHEAGAREGTLLYVALGAGLMGMWSSTLFGSGGAIQWQRWQGTLELLVGAPPRFIATMLPLTLATASIGLYSVVATLAWGRLLFGVPIDLQHPFLFAVALPATTVRAGAARPRAGVHVRALPACERVLEPARVPGVARHRAARARRAAARLGGADLLGAGAHLGRARRPRVGARRRPLAAIAHVRRAVGASTSCWARWPWRTSSGSPARARRSRSRDGLCVSSSSVACSATGRSSTGSARCSTSPRCSARRSSRSSSSPTSAASAGFRTTSGSWSGTRSRSAPWPASTA